MNKRLYALLDSLRRSVEFQDFEYNQSQNKRLEEITPSLHQELSLARKRLDPEIIQFLIKQKRYNLSMQFPAGCCLEITNFIYEDALNNENSIISQLIKEGFLVKKIFGISNDSIFENMIQVGSKLVYLINDSYDQEKDKIQILNKNNANFKQVNSYNQMFKVMEKYWNAEIYPNHIAPEIAMIFPYFIKVNNQIKFHQLHIANLLHSEVKTDFFNTEEFLFNSAYSNKKIPKQELDYLVNRLKERSNDMYKLFKESNPLLLDLMFPDLKLVNQSDFKRTYHNIKKRRNQSNNKEDFDTLLFQYSTMIYKHYFK